VIDIDRIKADAEKQAQAIVKTFGDDLRQYDELNKIACDLRKLEVSNANLTRQIDELKSRHECRPHLGSLFIVEKAVDDRQLDDRQRQDMLKALLPDARRGDGVVDLSLVLNRLRTISRD
jgi:hypothetical protein